MSEEETWHCVFCGRHWVGGPPTVETPNDRLPRGNIICCPSCMEYKGIERCSIDTCDCWDIRVVPEMMDILRDIIQAWLVIHKLEPGKEPTSQDVARYAGQIIEAMTPPKERYKECQNSSE